MTHLTDVENWNENHKPERMSNCFDHTLVSGKLNSEEEEKRENQFVFSIRNGQVLVVGKKVYCQFLFSKFVMV